MKELSSILKDGEYAGEQEGEKMAVEGEEAEDGLGEGEWETR